MIAIFAAVVMHWLVINDIHLNPFDATQGVPYGDDTNPWLLQRSIEEMRKSVPDASVIVLGGDLLAHHFSRLAADARRNRYAAAIAAEGSIATGLDRAFPHARVLLALGNNDDPCGDYRSETGGAYIAEVARIFEPLVDRDGAAPTFVHDFTHGGYYIAALPNGMRAVVFNSVLWSFVYRGSCQAATGSAPATEMTWAASMLSSGQNVVLMHMPLGFDPLSTSDTHRIVAIPFLASRYDERLRALFAQERAHVVFALAGHTHRYDFRVPGGVPMLVASSLSPIYHNAPAFYRLDVDGHELRDVTPYTYDSFSGRWVTRPSFDAMYGITSFSGAALRQVHQRVVDGPAVRDQWMQAYDVWSRHTNDLTKYRWQTFACAQVAFGGDYGPCAGTTKRSYAALIGAILGIVVAIAGFFFILKRWAVRGR